MRAPQTYPLNSTPTNNQPASSRLALSHKRKTLNTFEQQERKKRKPGTVAIRQIKFYQKTTDLLLLRLPFTRVVKEIGEKFAPPDSSGFRYTNQAIDVLQHAVEAYLVALFEDVNKAAIHAKRVTIRPEDMHLVRELRGRVDPNELL